MNVTIIIPFFNGYSFLSGLLTSIPKDIPIVIVDDHSDIPLRESDTIDHPNVRIVGSNKKGYFSGAVNLGINSCNTDVLVLNQDTWFSGSGWRTLLEEQSKKYDMIGERIRGKHPAHPEGYIHGTFMYMSREAIKEVGLLNDELYPLWGSTCEWQLRISRRGFRPLILDSVPDFHHDRPETSSVGNSILTAIEREPEKKYQFLSTPPLISMIIPCYNHGKYLKDTVNSLIGGETTIGSMAGQTLQSFEIIIVDDCSTDDTQDYIEKIVDPLQGIFSVRLPRNSGTAVAINEGMRIANGKFFATMSADDMREKDSFQLLYQTLIKNPHSFSYDDIVLIKDGARQKRANGKLKVWEMPEYNFDECLYKNQVHAGIMFPRQAFYDTGGYPEIMKDGREDWAMNVNLGIHGYCGVHIKYPGYLYRREGQNRTLKNTTTEYNAIFLDRLNHLFPSIYSGERPMACCGGRGKARLNGGNGRSTHTDSPLPGSSGMVLMDYLGDNYGNSTYWGEVTNTAYTFSKRQFRKNVDKRDVPGMLDLIDNRKQLFKVSPVDSVSVQTTKKDLPQGVDEETMDLVLGVIPGIGPATIDILHNNQIKTISEFINHDSVNLSEILNWKLTRVQTMQQVAKNKLG